MRVCKFKEKKQWENEEEGEKKQSETGLKGEEGFGYYFPAVSPYVPNLADKLALGYLWGYARSK